MLTIEVVSLVSTGFFLIASLCHHQQFTVVDLPLYRLNMHELK